MRLFNAMKRDAEAFTDLDRLVEVAPKHLAGRKTRATMLQSAGRFQEAESEYEALIALAPDDVTLFGRLGRVREAREDWAGAVQAYERFVARAPAHQAAAWCREAIVRCRAKQR